MERLQWIYHAGQEVLIMDLSTCHLAEALQVLERAKPMIRTRPPQSVLILTDVTGSTYNLEWANAIKPFARDNTPYVRASAVVGVKGLGHILMSAVQTFSGRGIRSFADRDAALAWLVGQ